MQRVSVLLLVVLVGAAALVAGARPLAGDARAAAGQVRECGLPNGRTVWIDFADGSVPFWYRFARPGIVAAASNFLYPPQLRAGGAKTVYFDLYLNNRVGRPTRALDPAVAEDWANKMYYRAVASTGCARPWFALNELFGAGTSTPWTRQNAQYRANVLIFVRTLAARGARPFLLVPTKPYTAGEAAEWWRQIAQVSDIVREVYFTAPQIHRMGTTLGSRRMRNAFRRGILDFTEIGVPRHRLGLFLGFQTGRGNGGREGLERMAWFQHTKLQVLAARQVASELGIHTIWSWGWAAWTEADRDPDKEIAACVYLWTRDPRLCAGPALAGPAFDADVTEGQIILPRGVQCSIGGGYVTNAAIGRLARILGDRQAAYTALAARVVARGKVPVSEREIVRAERAVIAYSFGGSVRAYVRAVRRAGASRAMARAVIADELRQAVLAPHLRVRRPTGADVTEWYRTYASVVSARAVEVHPAAPWLGGRTKGLAIAGVAPAQALAQPAGKVVRVRTHGGVYRVRAFGKPLPLGAYALERAVPAIHAALLETAREEAYRRWSLRRQTSALDTAVCRRDALPAVGSVDLTEALPFLALQN